MKLMCKKAEEKEPQIIIRDNLKSVQELVKRYRRISGFAVRVHQLTYDGLYALCDSRGVHESILRFDKVNSAFSVFGMQSPESVYIAISDIVFFRVKDTVAVSKVVEVDLLKLVKPIEVCPLTETDIENIKIMLSPPCQLHFITATIDECEIMKERHPFSKPRAGVLMTPVYPATEKKGENNEKKREENQ